MKIAIDCRTILNPGLGEQAGVGHYTYYLVWHLLRQAPKMEFVLFFDQQLSDEVIQSIIGKHSACRVKRLPFFDYRHYAPGVYSHFLMSQAIAREKPSLLHIPGGNLPLAYQGKTILTVHDLAIYRQPKWFPRQLIAAKFLYPQSLRRAVHLIVPSKQTSRDLQDIFKIAAKKISVIYEGVTLPKNFVKLSDLKKKYKIDSPYIFFLGTIEPRKNLEFLLDVYDLWRQNNGDKKISLVLAGGRGWKYGDVFKKIEKINRQSGGEQPAVNYLGYAPDEDKWALLKNALCFVFPSLYEGFGLPPLEAMACGAPVLASKNSSLIEVVGKGGRLLPADDVNGWLDALDKIFQNRKEKNRLSEAGKKQAARFSWEKCAAETLDVYQKLFESQEN